MQHLRLGGALALGVWIASCTAPNAGFDSKSSTDEQFVAEALRRARNTQDGIGDFRNVMLVAPPGDRAVCGEAQDKLSERWTRFFTHLDEAGVNFFPHDGVSEAAISYFDGRCSAVAAAALSGAKATTQDQMSCEASLALAGVATERRRFELLWSILCGPNSAFERKRAI